MKKETYIKLMDWGKARKKRTLLIDIVNKAVTGIIYIAYPMLLYALYQSESKIMYKVMLVPAVSFLLVSVFRYLYNEERPYTRFQYEPIIIKEKAGKSMPSRHVFSAFIIAMAFFYIRPIYGMPIFLCGIIMCIGRVLAGVHYPKDVIVGAVLGIAFGILGFYVLPI